MTKRFSIIFLILSTTGVLTFGFRSKRESDVRRFNSNPAESAELGILPSDLFWGTRAISQPQAIETVTSLKNVTVAVIDTGTDISHRSLKNQLWINPGEVGKDAHDKDKQSNGIDDDKNGYIDDVHGWNFVDNNNDISDLHGHGTHIAGIIAARSSTEPQNLGVAPNARLMILKYYDPHSDGKNNIVNTIKAIRYATKMGADIINYSAGGLTKNTAEERAIQEAATKNITFIAAAGNEASNSDFHPYYPAGYDLENVISVTAINQNIQILPTSNYGTSSVDIAAPGADVYSTLPNNQFGVMTGTSQATAYVSGVAALLLGAFPALKQPGLLTQQLIKTGAFEPSTLTGKVKSSVRLNAYNAVVVQSNSLTHAGTVNTPPPASSHNSLHEVLDALSSPHPSTIERRPSAF